MLSVSRLLAVQDRLLYPMEMVYSRLIARLWRSYPRLQAKAVRRFQSVEADGVWHLFQVLQQTTDPRERAKVFQHVLEEDSHAELFRDVFCSENSECFQPLQSPRSELTPGGFEAWRAFVHVHVGEVSATRRFTALSRALPEGPLSSALKRIVRDEEGHIGLTEELARHLQVEERKVASELLAVRWSRFIGSLRQLALQAMNQITGFLLIVGYWLLGGFAALTLRARMRQPRVLVNNNYMKKFLP
jgi:hypothetical protein